MECLIEFIVYGILNIYTKDFSKNGEIIGFCIAVFCLFCVNFVIIALIWAIFTKSYT